MQRMLPWNSIAVFLLVSFGLAWLIALPLWFGGGLRNPFFGVIAAAMMFAPLVAVIIVCLFVEHRPLKTVPALVGLVSLRPLRRLIRWSVLGLLGAELLVFAGVGVVIALGLVRADLVGFSGFAEMLREASPQRQDLPVTLIAILQIAAIPIGGVLNCFVTIGEEVGWRGWLLPVLSPLGIWPAMIVTGVAWGLWHTPLILLGYNFAQPNGWGVVLMVIACVLIGILFSWLRLRSGSLWPSMIAHGTFNAAAGTLLVITAAGQSPDPVLTGPLGICAWLPMVLLIAVLAASGQFRSAIAERPGAPASGAG